MSRYLNTDLYEVTMALGYLRAGMAHREAHFELFFRDLPRRRNFVVAAGVDRAVEFAQGFKLDGEDIDYLRAVPAFGSIADELWEQLEALPPPLRIYSVREGEVVFPHEPVVRIEGPLATCQLLETAIISLVHYPSVVASKAARVRFACRGKTFLEFGMRRAPMLEAALEASRVAYMVGADAVSNTECGRRFGIPVAGTMAHSWVMSFPTEREAFQSFIETFPELGILLIDTWGVEHGLSSALQVDGRLRAVRIDSGRLKEETRWVRRMLDQAGKEKVRIILSGNLDEYIIDELLREGVPVDSFGVGTEMVNSTDSPKISYIYKLVAVENGEGKLRPTIKISPGKKTWPWGKQVLRRLEDGVMAGDLIIRHDEEGYPGEPLVRLRWSRKEGWREPPRQLEENRHFCISRLNQLPPGLRDLYETRPYPVEISSRLERERRALEMLELARVNLKGERAGRR